MAERRIALQPIGRGVFNYHLCVSASTTSTQKRRVISCLRSWRRPGPLRWLRRWLGEPVFSELKSDGESDFEFAFRDEYCRKAVMKSAPNQIELAGIVADTLGWGEFVFQRGFTSGRKEYRVHRDSTGAPWQFEDISPPQPPRLREPLKQLRYRHT